MIKVDVFVQEKKWKKYISNPQKYLKNKTKNIKNLIPFIKNKKIVFSILLTGNSGIKKFNKKFRKKNKTTDILSFPFYNKKLLNKKINTTREVYLGDVIINLIKLKYKNNIKKFHEEFNKLWIHGIVHLFGYKHQRNKDFFKMNKIEKKYFSYLI